MRGKDLIAATLFGGGSGSSGGGSGGGGSGAKFATGAITMAESAKSLVITHDLGVTPNCFFFLQLDGNGNTGETQMIVAADFFPPSTYENYKQAYRRYDFSKWLEHLLSNPDYVISGASKADERTITISEPSASFYAVVAGRTYAWVAAYLEVSQ